MAKNMIRLFPSLATVCASLAIFSCDDPPHPTESQDQKIVRFNWSKVEAEQSQSGEREFSFRIEAVRPRAELELRFEFPEPKSLKSVHSTQEETIIVLEGDEAEYRLDHRALLDEVDRYREAGLISLDRFKNNNGQQGGAGQPATRTESDSEGGDKPQPEAEGRSR